MAADIQRERPTAEVELIGEEDQLGMFRVVANGKQLWNKHDTGSFPEPNEIVAQL